MFFLNYKNGSVSINTYRLAGAVSTDMYEIVEAYKEDRQESLTASIDAWANEELKKIGVLNKEDAETIIFSENDFFDRVLEGVFGLRMSDYPDLRDIQRDYIDAL